VSQRRNILAKKLEAALLRQWYPGAEVSSSAIYPLTYLLEKVHIAARRIRPSSKHKMRVGEPRPFKPFVIVIGNLTVGGTGKTPLLIELAEQLISSGLTLAVISRGYAATATKNIDYPHSLSSSDNSNQVGDEPLLIYQTLNAHHSDSAQDVVQVVVGPKRRACVEKLCEQTRPDIILSDDGLQHYQLPRDFEICVIDSERGFGNGKLLPHGPLREPISALRDIDAVVTNGAPSAELIEQLRHYRQSAVPMQVSATSVYALNTIADNDIQQIEELLSTYATLYAIAGIGNPQRFFKELRRHADKNRQAGLISANLVTQPFADHYQYDITDINSITADAINGRSALIMTEKDAVKCRDFINQIQMPVYVAKVTTELDPALLSQITRHFNAYHAAL